MELKTIEEQKLWRDTALAIAGAIGAPSSSIAIKWADEIVLAYRERSAVYVYPSTTKLEPGGTL